MCRRFRQRSDRRVVINRNGRKAKQTLFCHFKNKSSSEWKNQPNWVETRETGQAQDKLRTSSGQAQDKVYTDNPDIERLIAVIGKDQMSVKMMMEKLQLKGRDNFLRLYLFPALEEGFVTLLYPDKPRHPRQKYLLTVKGLALLSEL